MNWQKMMFKYAKKPNSIEIDKQKRKCEWLKYDKLFSRILCNN